MYLWLYILGQVATGKSPAGAIASKMLEYRYFLKSVTNGQGQKLLNYQEIQMKLMSKICHCLCRELIKAVKSGKI